MSDTTSGADRVSAMDRMFEAVRANRVTERREQAGPTAPDFYVYRFYVDGARATATQQRALAALRDRGAVHADSYAGLMGPAEVRLDIG